MPPTHLTLDTQGNVLKTSVCPLGTLPLLSLEMYSCLRSSKAWGQAYPCLTYPQVPPHSSLVCLCQ